MKIATVGSGAQGTGLAGLLIREPDVTEIVLADHDTRAIDNAAALVASLHDSASPASIRVVTVDARNPEDLQRAVAGTAIVFNATVPAFNLPIMRAALTAGAHYLDLFAFPVEGIGVPRSQTIAGQFDLHDEFRSADLTALPSIGVTPGWTSLAAQDAIDNLDTVDEVIVRFLDWVDTDEMFLPVSPEVIMHEWLGAPFPARSEHGKLNAVDLLDSEEQFDFQGPIGTRPVYTVTAHPDIVLIPQFAGKPIGRCEEKFGIQVGRLDTKSVLIKALQQVTSRQGPHRQNVNVLEEMGKRFRSPSDFNDLVAAGKIRDAAVVFTTEVNGLKDGRFQRHLAYYTATLAAAREQLPWASPAVYGTVGGMPIELVLALGRGEITTSGVLSVGQLDMGAALTARMMARGQHIQTHVWTDTGGFDATPAGS